MNVLFGGGGNDKRLFRGGISCFLLIYSTDPMGYTAIKAVWSRYDSGLRSERLP